MWGQIGFQDALSPIILALEGFHYYVIVLLSMIRVYVVILIISTFRISPVEQRPFIHKLEAVWTILPGVLLIFLALPSLRLLYIIEEVATPVYSIKVIGHQWYWSYDLGYGEYDSYITQTEDLRLGDLRVLDVDNRLTIPYGLWLRILVSSADVLHSWRVPSLGLKVDAVPGRLNQLTFISLLPGVFYGRCTEICGANHSFIPICVESVSPSSWIHWV